MTTNTLFQSLTDTLPLTQTARDLHGVVDQLTAALVGRLISERCLDYGGQPGESIEYVARIIADTLVASLPEIDIVAICRVHGCKPSVGS